MKIISGLFDSMVLQRAGAHSDVQVCGEAANGTLYYRYGTKGWKKCGNVRVGIFRFRLKGIPVGGPYRVELQVRRGQEVCDRHVVRDVLVGDVWVCAGQSNMQGAGLLKYAATPQPKVRAFYMDDRWAIAKDPIHNMWATVDPVHVSLCGVLPLRDTHYGTGPAVEFGAEMWRRTHVPQGLLACAHGGISMTSWDPQLPITDKYNLYRTAVRRIKKNGGRIAGILWYQGENETTPTDAPLYTERMQRLIRAFRRDAHSPRLPFVLAQLARVVIDGRKFDAANWNSVQEQQRQLQRIPHVAVVPTVDLRMDDHIHISGADLQRLGRRFAQAMHVLQAGRRAGKPPIALRSIKVERNPHTGYGDIRVRFDNVQGKLCSSQGRALGFDVIGGINGPCLFDTVLRGKEVVLRTVLFPDQLEGLAVHYGEGADPHCNIMDEGGRSLPVFGPLRIPRTKAITPFVNEMRISKVFPADRSLHAVSLPKSLKGRDWEIMKYSGVASNVWGRFQASELSDKCLFLHWKLRLREPMKLAARLGYDGPVKLWVDGKLVMHDPEGGRPLRADSRHVRFSAGKGTHDVVLAFGAGTGEAVGACLRFERLGIPAKLLQTGTFRMPEILA